MKPIYLLPAMFSLFLLSFLSLQYNINDTFAISAITIDKNHIYYLSSTLPPVGQPVPVTNNPLPPVGEPVPVPNNPFSTAEGVPEIVLKYNDTIYNGVLRSAIFSSGDVNDNMPSLENNSNNITNTIPKQIINITHGEQIQLMVSENPMPELQPNSISSTLYHLNGNVSKILSLKEEDKMDTFIVDANKGEYLLLAIATWLPNPDNYLTTTGYVSYLFRLSVV